MLGLKNGMPPEWSLLPVIRKIGRSKSFQEKIAGVGPYFFDTVLFDISEVFGGEFETRAEF